MQANTNYGVLLIEKNILNLSHNVLAKLRLYAV